MLWELIEERCLEVLNGVKDGDGDREFIYIGKIGESVIGWSYTDQQMKKVGTFKIGKVLTPTTCY